MSNPFSLTLRSVQADSLRRVGLVAGLGAALLLGWAGWFWGAELTVYAQSRQARIEITGHPSPVIAERAGRIIELQAAIGDLVQEGQVIVELDSSSALLELDEARAVEAALSTRLDALRRELAASTDASGSASDASRSQQEAARAGAEAANARAELARLEAERAERLFQSGHISSAEHDTLVTAARAREAEAREQASTFAQTRAGGVQSALERSAALASLQGEADALESELEAAWSRAARLELALDQTQIRASTAGRLAELATLSVGSWVEPGVTIGTVVPEGELQIIADFAPSDALGRVLPGQQARMRLDGFPWTRYGTLAATVSRVSEEPRGGMIRVELAPSEPASGAANSSLPMLHALSGSVEIAVDRLSPGELVLRAVGRALTDHPREERLPAGDPAEGGSLEGG